MTLKAKDEEMLELAGQLEVMECKVLTLVEPWNLDPDRRVCNP